MICIFPVNQSWLHAWSTKRARLAFDRKYNIVGEGKPCTIQMSAKHLASSMVTVTPLVYTVTLK